MAHRLRDEEEAERDRQLNAQNNNEQAG
jgi:hypothetical protein